MLPLAPQRRHARIISPRRQTFQKGKRTGKETFSKKPETKNQIARRGLDFLHRRTKTDEDSDDENRVGLRSYQRAVFEDHTSGIVVLHWSRQIGKSFVLAAWAVIRLLKRPGSAGDGACRIRGRMGRSF